MGSLHIGNVGTHTECFLQTLSIWQNRDPSVCNPFGSPKPRSLRIIFLGPLRTGKMMFLGSSGVAKSRISETFPQLQN